MATPSFPTGNAVLTGVTALGSRDAWAVGYVEPNGGTRQALVLRWDGRAWTRVPIPNGTAQGGLYGIVGVTSRDVWAVGSADDKTTVLRWNGVRWRVVASPNGRSQSAAENGRLNAVTYVPGTRPVQLWAVGTYTLDDFRAQTLLLRWNGRRWTRMPSPETPAGEDYYELNAVTATSQDNAWAVGAVSSGWGDGRSLIARWNGRRWALLAHDHTRLDGDYLTGVAAESSRRLWAVGGEYRVDGGQRLLIQRSRDHSCALQRTPSEFRDETDESGLNEITRLPSGTLWAVGWRWERTPTGFESRTLTLRRRC